MKKKAERKAYSMGKTTRKTLSIGSDTIPVKCGITKHYLKSKQICRVTFRLPKEAAPNARIVSIAGDFNDWDTNVTQMKRLKNGDYTVVLNLACNREYRFRYLIDGNRWENDWKADKYAPNAFGCDDSIVVV